MYARADYKPRIPEAKSLETYISNDIAGFKKSESDLIVSREQPIRFKDQIEFQVVFYSPAEGSTGNWEYVAYGEDGEYYLTFGVSSRTSAGLTAALPAFKAFIAGYRAGP